MTAAAAAVEPAAAGGVLYLQQLPPPVAPQEAAFRRMLAATERALDALPSNLAESGSGTAGGGAFDPQAAKLKHYVETLQEQFAELERSHAIELGFSTLAAYKQAVAAAAARAPAVTLPSYCVKPKPKAQPPARAAPAGNVGASAMDQQQQQQRQHQRRQHQHQPSGETASDGGGALSDALSDATKKTLAHQEQLHEAITDELVGLAAALKASTLGVQQGVDRRGELVDTTEGHLDTSTQNARDVAQRSKRQLKRGGSTFCLTLGILLAVGLVFTLMVVYIKFSYLLGYRAHGGRASAPPPSRATRQWGGAEEL